jgi:phosphatidate cytidylyltransferase
MNATVLRVLVAVGGIPVVLVLIWLGGLWFAAATTIVSTVMLREFYQLCKAKGVHPNEMFGMALGIGIHLAMGSYLVVEPILWKASVLFVVCISACVIVAELWRNKTSPLLNVATTVMGVLYISMPMGVLILLRAQQSNSIDNLGWWLCIMVFLCIWITDSVAYFVGLRFGRSRLFERISPKKSWEGAMAGGVACVVACVVVCHVAMPSIPLWWSTMTGLLIAVFAPLGDLAESMLKRDAVVKDSSGLLPGHGGLLDRFDAFLVVLPIVFGCVLLLQNLRPV